MREEERRALVVAAAVTITVLLVALLLMAGFCLFAWAFWEGFNMGGQEPAKPAPRIIIVR